MTGCYNLEVPDVGDQALAAATDQLTRSAGSVLGSVKVAMSAPNGHTDRLIPLFTTLKHR